MSSRPQRLRIVHVVLSSRLAGGEQYALDLAAGQQADGHEVHVIGPARSVLPRHVHPDIPYHALRWPIGRKWQVRQIVKRLQPDVVHGHLGPACKATAHSGAATRVATLHVGFKPHQHAHLDGLICVNRAQMAQLSGYAGRRRVVYNWAPDREPVQDSEAFRRELGLSDEQVLVVSVGRLHRAKGFDQLIDAFRQHAPAHAVLAIVGEGDERPDLERRIAGDARIRLVGFRKDVDAALHSGDLFVSSSREEAFPLAMLEALRAGRPVVATRTQGAIEMLHGTGARLVPLQSVDELGVALHLSITQLSAQPRALRPSLHYALGAYDRQRAIRDIVDFYRETQSDLRRRGTDWDEHGGEEELGHA